jgi:hypothetical protein
MVRDRERPTVPPPFDPESYAESSEQSLRVTDEQSIRVTSSRRIPPMTARPRVVMSTDDLAWLELSDVATRTLTIIDGSSTVLDLMGTTVVTGDELFEALDELVREGAVSLSKK